MISIAMSPNGRNMKGTYMGCVVREGRGDSACNSWFTTKRSVGGATKNEGDWSTNVDLKE